MDTPVIVEQQSLTYICTGFHRESLTREITDRDGWRERIKGIHAQLNDDSISISPSGILSFLNVYIQIHI